MQPIVILHAIKIEIHVIYGKSTFVYFNLASKTNPILIVGPGYFINVLASDPQSKSVVLAQLL